VMNDLKIPLGVAFSLLVFREAAHWPRLLAGTSVIATALWLASREGARTTAPSASRTSAAA